MLGAIIGDTAASVYERRKYTGGDWNVQLFPAGSRFTDDTVLTIACFDAMKDINAGASPEKAFRARFQEYARMYPNAGYGQKFREWIEHPAPYGSFGNGAAMRVSPIGWLCDDAKRVLELAAASASVSHDHPEGIKAAQAVAMAVFMARKGASKDGIRGLVANMTSYDLDRKLADIRPSYRWSSHSQTSVPEALICFLDSDDFEGAIRNAIWLGGDADTQAAIAGSIAEAFYGEAPGWMMQKARALLDGRLKDKVDEWLALGLETDQAWDWDCGDSNER